MHEKASSFIGYAYFNLHSDIFFLIPRNFAICVIHLEKKYVEWKAGPRSVLVYSCCQRLINKAFPFVLIG